MPGITSLLDIGKKSLFANQAAIQVTGNNVSNANTPGYSRQAVRFEDGNYINYSPGQLGTGVKAAEVIRYFDEFVELQYNAKTSEEQRWRTLHESLKGVEGILNEANSKGVNSALSEFWADWQKLSANPQSISVKSALLGHAANLESIIQSTGQDLRRLQTATDDFIDQEVTRINDILGSIARINTQITSNEVPGKNNANGLRDERAALVRQLAEKMDIDYIDNGLGNISIATKAGHTLVDGVHAFHLSFEKPQAWKNLIQRPSGIATYAGNVHFEGSSSHEYTLEVLTDGQVATSAPPAPGTATFRASIDGGKTWLKDSAGNERHFYASDLNNKVTLPDGGPSIYFDQATGDPGRLLQGDVFNITPKKGLYWYENSSSKMNITPQVFPNGEDNSRRLVGGTLSGYFHFRDQSIGGYLEKLDAFAGSLTWEVNRIHSQGAGASRFTDTTGTYKATNTNAPLGGLFSGLDFAEKMTGGNVMVHVYNKSTGALEASRTLDFGTTPGIQNFDPSTHTLENVRAAFQGAGLNATIRDGHLNLQAPSGKEFVFGADSSGLLAALGLNTFFSGSDARTLALNPDVINSLDRINAGHVNGAGEMNSGDNTTAKALAALQTKKVNITTIAEGTTIQTLGEYYSSLVSKAGADTANAKFTRDYHAALAKDLHSRQEAVSGVNLDEEITNLIKFQHSYTAAAKLITTAESMLQVLLGLKS